MSLSSPLNHASAFMLKLGVLLAMVSPMSAFAEAGDLQNRSKQDMVEGLTTHGPLIYESYFVPLMVCVAIGIVVFGAMIFSIIFHRKSRGVTPATFEHSTVVEIVWTIIPFFILVFLAVPSARLIMDLEDVPGPDEDPIEIQVTAHQWLWTYNYVADADSQYQSKLAEESNAARKLGSGVDVSAIKNYLLDVDKPLVIPVKRKIILKINSTDVIHAWWVPELAVKKDAVPGYTNVVWFEATTKGTFRGVCAELCGRDHGYMPIVVKVVDDDEYRDWVKGRQEDNVKRRKELSAAAQTDSIVATEVASAEGAL